MMPPLAAPERFMMRSAVSPAPVYWSRPPWLRLTVVPRPRLLPTAGLWLPMDGTEIVPAELRETLPWKSLAALARTMVPLPSQQYSNPTVAAAPLTLALIVRVTPLTE